MENTVFLLLLVWVFFSKIDGQISLIPDPTYTKELEITPFVVGGEDTNAESAPWHALLELKTETKFDKLVNHCGGNILSPTVILTAAHCVWQNKPKCPEYVRNLETAEDCHRLSGGCPDGCTRVRPRDLNVYVGVTHIKQPVRIPPKVKSIILHPGWNKTSDSSDSLRSGHDLAIIVLKSKLKFSSKVRHINLPEQNLRLRSGQFVSLNGFGFTNAYKGTFAKRLQHGRLNIKSKSECISAYDDSLNWDQLVCAYSANTGSCKGDSGSGLIARVRSVPTLVGTVSFGQLQCTRKPGVYTNVQAHMDWIQQTLRNVHNTDLGTWRGWSTWSSCSQSCGGGTKIRRRSCKENNCQGLYSEERSCNTKSCGKECITVSGPSTGFPCIFPFTYQGQRHSSCIKESSPDGEHFWCPTKVDMEGAYLQGHWGRCRGACEASGDESDGP